MWWDNNGVNRGSTAAIQRTDDNNNAMNAFRMKK